MNLGSSSLWIHLVLTSNLIVTCLSASEFGFHFTEWPQWHVVAPGQEVQLKCSTNLLPEKMRWLHNHRFIHPEKELKRRSGNESKASSAERKAQMGHLTLQISTNQQIYKKQEGLYQCVSSIFFLSVTSLPGRIQVGYLKPFPVLSSTRNNVKVEPGSSFKIPCQRPDSLPEARLLFYKDAKLLNTSNKKKFYVTDAGDLVVLRARMSSRGVYWCSARNDLIKETQTNDFQTSVAVRRKKKTPSSVPRLTSFDSIVKRVVGMSPEFICIVTNGEADTVFWTFKNTRLAHQTQFNNGVSISLTNVTRNDEGLYRCQGRNAFGTTFTDVNLVVQEKPNLLVGPQGHAIEEGSNITVSCEFEGVPFPTVAWVFFGELLASNDNVLVNGDSLHIYSIARKQAGVYQCFGFNPFGTAQGSAIVTIIPRTVMTNATSSEITNDGKENKINQKETKRKKNQSDKRKSKNSKKEWMTSPSRPNVTKISDESVMVTWDLNANSSRLIQFFKVQYKNLSGKKTSMQHTHKWKTLDEDIAPHVRSYEVTGLDTGLIYRFRVAAIYVNNDSRSGKSSLRFLLKKSEVLEPPEEGPEIVTISEKNNNSLVVEWQNDAETLVEGFIIYYRDASTIQDYTKITLLGAENKNYTIPNLDPRVPYDFKLCSFNMAGRSNFSEMFIFVPEGMDVNQEPPVTDEVLVPFIVDETKNLPKGILYASIGAGLACLFSIVIISFTCYSCKNKDNLGEEIVDSKYMDTSLRIHRQTKMESDLEGPPNFCAPLLPTSISPTQQNNLDMFSTKEQNIHISHSNI